MHPGGAPPSSFRELLDAYPDAELLEGTDMRALVDRIKEKKVRRGAKELCERHGLWQLKDLFVLGDALLAGRPARKVRRALLDAVLGLAREVGVSDEPAPAIRRAPAFAPPPPPPMADPPPGAAPIPPAPTPDDPIAEQLRWLRAAGAGWLLGFTLTEVLSRLPHVGSAPIGEYLDNLARAGASPNKEVHSWLLNQVEAVERSLLSEQRQRLWNRRPDDPALVEFYERLLSVRAKLRRKASPLPTAPFATHLYAREGSPPTAEIEVRAELISQVVGRTSLGIRSEAHGKLTFECQGRFAAEPALQLGLVDIVLEALLDPERNSAYATIRDFVREPAWRRALTVLARDEREVAERVRVIWKLAPDSIQLFRSVRGKRGWRKPEPVTVNGLLDTREGLPLQDLAAIDLLAADPDAVGSRLVDDLDQALYAAVLEKLEGHPDLVSADSEAPLTVQKDTLRVHVVRGAEHVELLPRFAGRVRALGEAKALSDRAKSACAAVWIEEEAGEAWAVLMPPTARRAVHVAQALEVRIPNADLPAALPALLDLARPLDLRLDEGLAPTAEAPPQFILRVEPEGEGDARLELRVRPAPEAPTFLPGDGPERLPDLRQGAAKILQRDLSLEQRLALEHAEALGFPDLDGARLPVPRVLALLPAAEARGIEVERPKAWRVRAATLSDLSVRVAPAKRGFLVTGELKVDQASVALALLLEARRHDERFVPMSPNQWAELSPELERVLDDVEPSLEAQKAGIVAHPVGHDSLRALTAAVAAPQLAPEWRDVVARIDAAEALEPRLPKDLQADLRDYQRESFAWMARLAHRGLGACLADEMGLGKTVQAIAMLLERGAAGPALVVTPTSVGFNWLNELRRFAPRLDALAYRGPGREDLPAPAAGQVWVTSYDILIRDAERLAAIPFATVVFDEAQALKNHRSQRSRAARDLRAGWRLALTGTPIENDVGDLFSILDVVSPGLLGARESFVRRFGPSRDEAETARRLSRLSTLVRPFVLRRKKADVATELPPRIEVRVDVELSEAEAKLYRAVHATSVREIAEAALPGLEAERRFRVLTVLTRLRQLACHPRLYDRHRALESSKHARLLELLEELRAGGQSALVFSQFVRQLDLLKETLEQAGIPYLFLSGRTPAAERARLVERFQAKEAPFFLVSLKAGGTGLNLTAADAVVHLDPWWNPAVEDQASDRAHRIGRTGSVTIYRLVAAETVEEAIVDMQANKRATAEAVMGGAAAAAKLSTEELVALIEASARA